MAGRRPGSGKYWKYLLRDVCLDTSPVKLQGKVEDLGAVEGFLPFDLALPEHRVEHRYKDDIRVRLMDEVKRLVHLPDDEMQSYASASKESIHGERSLCQLSSRKTSTLPCSLSKSMKNRLDLV